MKKKRTNRLAALLLIVALAIPIISSTITERSAYRKDLSLFHDISDEMSKYDKVLTMLDTYISAFTDVKEGEIDYMFNNGFPYSLNDKGLKADETINPQKHNHKDGYFHAFNFPYYAVNYEENWCDYRSWWNYADGVTKYSLYKAVYGFLDDITKEKMLEYAKYFENEEMDTWINHSKVYSAYFDYKTKRWVRVTDDLWAKGKTDAPRTYICKEEYLVLKDVDISKTRYGYIGAFNPDGSSALGENGSFAKYFTERPDGYPSFADLGADLSQLGLNQDGTKIAKKNDKTSKEKEADSKGEKSKDRSKNDASKEDKNSETVNKGVIDGNKSSDTSKKYEEDDKTEIISNHNPDNEATDEITIVSEETTAPTCTENGLKISIYSDGSKEETQLPATGHKYEIIKSVSPTCEKEGKTTYKCSLCGDIIEENTQKLEHNFVKEITKEASCEENGECRKECTNCNIVEIESIPAKGHSEIAETTTPTLFKKGTIITRCSECGKILNSEDIPAKTNMLIGIIAIIAAMVSCIIFIVLKKR